MRRVTVVMGGSNSEREVSLTSGQACAKALEELGYAVNVLEIGKEHSVKDWVLSLLHSQPDVIFNALHGLGGEDGKVQGIFEHLGIPYTHSGVLASALGMNKAISKTMFQAVGLPVAPSVVVPVVEAAKRHVMEPPYVIKPLNEGSSIGVHIVRKGDDLPSFLLSEEWKFGPEVMIEQYIEGFELTCGILGNRPLGILDVQVGTHQFYDYKAKYEQGGSSHKTPSYLSPSMEKMVEDIALKAHQTLGCRGVTRSDFRFDPTRGEKGLFLLEINTQPGMTSTSLVPEMAANKGMSFTKLVEWITQDALRPAF